MILCRDKIEVFIDKGYQHLPLAYEVLNYTFTSSQAHFLGFVSGEQLKEDYPNLYQKINYMPLILPSDTLDQLMKPFTGINIKYYLFSFPDVENSYFEWMKSVAKNQLAMATTQVPRYCAGYTDAISLHNPDAGWGWIIDQGFNAILYRPSTAIN